MKCYGCYTLIEKRWNYCPNCKKVLKKKKNKEEFVSCDESGKCHTCSFVLSDNWNFCPICGTNVDFGNNKVAINLNTIAAVEKNYYVPLITATDNKKEEILHNNDVSKKVCPNCNTEVLEQHAFCSKCGYHLKNSEEVQHVTNNDGTQDNPAVLLFLTVVSVPLGMCLRYLGYDEMLFLGYGVSLFSIIFAKVLYPKNKLVNVVFWVFIVLSILFLISFFAFLFLAVYACYACVEGLGG